MAADALHVRIAHLEGIYEQVDKRFGGIEMRLGHLDTARSTGRSMGLMKRSTDYAPTWTGR
jgi:hypothetical protein